ncbi:hypothetical protein ALC53_07882, partial [Atta colombica]
HFLFIESSQWLFNEHRGTCSNTYLNLGVIRTLCTYSAKMMPHQIVKNTLGHALRSQMAYIQLLITPLDPSCLRRYAVYQAQCIYFLRMGECKSCQYIGTSSDSETNYRFYAKVAKDEEQLFSQLFHGRIISYLKSNKSRYLELKSCIIYLQNSRDKELVDSGLN